MGGVIQKPHRHCAEEIEKDAEALSVLRGYTLPLLNRSASFAFHLHHVCIVFALHLHCRMLGQEKAFWRDFHQTLRILRSSTGTQVFFLSCDDNTTWTGPS